MQIIAIDPAPGAYPECKCGPECEWPCWQQAGLVEEGTPCCCASSTTNPQKESTVGEVITITGHSDDIVNIDGNGSGPDEASEGASLILLGANDQSANAGVRVRMRYNGVWTAEIGPVQEDMPMLVTLVSLADNGYSVKVEVHGAVTLVQEAVEA